MNKLAKLIAAAHASVLVSGIAAGGAVAQSAAEVKAYMEAVRTGTPDAIASFMRHYPKSTLPGSELGDRIASSPAAPRRRWRRPSRHPRRASATRTSRSAAALLSRAAGPLSWRWPAITPPRPLPQAGLSGAGLSGSARAACEGASRGPWRDAGPG